VSRTLNRPVPRPERELVAAIRAELLAIDPIRPCDRASEAAGLDVSSGERHEAGAGSLGGRTTRDAGLARLVRRLGEPGTPVEPIAWAEAPEHCRIAWLRGRFLARGSLSLAAGRTHLEFVVDRDEAAELARRLADVGLPASWRLRRGTGVVTWKSSETVGTFLRWIGAGAALLELEARQVSRALRGELNRVLNAESANLGRAVEASGRQLEAVALLDADGRLAHQPHSVRLVADARRETPEASLAELAERVGLHRSAVQRALARIERLAADETERPTALA
jgi:DNA-binding transcriptional regulator WhiA